MKSHALAVFHRQPENFNCAQAVLDAWQTKMARQLAPVAEFKAFGGGRAPGGECGALYAACFVAPDRAGDLRAAFEKRAGSILCRTLKADLRVPCTECVGLAADLLSGAA